MGRLSWIAEKKREEEKEEEEEEEEEEEKEQEKPAYCCQREHQCTFSRRQNASVRIDAESRIRQSK